MSESHHQQPQSPNQRSNIPIPDPSVLTTEALDREVGHLRELLGGRVDEIARDFQLFKDTHGDHHAAAVDSAIQHRRELTEEQFRGVQAKLESIQRQFEERDERLKVAFEAAEKAMTTALYERERAVQAALGSTEKAVAKSEATFTKEIDSIKELIATTAKAQDQQIRDIKDEQTGTRGRTGGIDKTWAFVMTLAPILISVVGVAIVIASR
jgi:hypothetical protein